MSYSLFQIEVAVFCLALASSKAIAQSSVDVQAYASMMSVAPGGSITFYVNNSRTPSAQSVPFSVYRVGSSDAPVFTATAPSKVGVIDSDASICQGNYSTGCGWSPSYEYKVPSSWRSGLYYAKFGTPPEDRSKMNRVYFVVRAAQPGTTSNILVALPFATWQAYNQAGGGSFYWPSPSVGPQPVTLSLLRPVLLDSSSDASNSLNPDNPEEGSIPIFIKWLEQNGYVAEYASSIDLDQISGLLLPYQLIIIAGHDEYWSQPMRDQFDQFVKAGGNAMILSGNTMTTRIQFTPDSQGGFTRMSTNRGCFNPPYSDYVDAWVNLNNSEIRSIGLVFNNNAASATTRGAILGDLSCGASGGGPSLYGMPVFRYSVQAESSWVFRNLYPPLEHGPTTRLGGIEISGFPASGVLSRGETDAVSLNTNVDPVVADGSDGAPHNLTVLAYADLGTNGTIYCLRDDSGLNNRSGRAVIATYDNNGTIFNAGSTWWLQGLRPELHGISTVAGTITKTVLDRLSQPKTTLSRSTTLVFRHHFTLSDGQEAFLTIDPFYPPYGFGSVYDGGTFWGLVTSVANAIPVYQYRRQHAGADRHYYTTDPNVQLAGWSLDGSVFWAFSTQQPGTLPVYEYHLVESDGSGWRYCYTTASPNFCQGWTVNGVTFYVPESR